jgi:hypothetical protein
MNKKNIIQIIIIVCAFGGSGLILYNYMFKKPAALPLAVTVDKSGLNLSTEKVLPYGNTLDFKKVLDRQDLTYGVVTYPKLDFTGEVGILGKDLIMVSSAKQ